ncbi:kelch-like protein 13 [Branchiostoma lanceolatum]|uniref:kelch-like protein 13 n=1 Tax=Branchiostoma lanceolatum TaxID=7740 RepID=UPI003455971F
MSTQIGKPAGRISVQGETTGLSQCLKRKERDSDPEDMGKAVPSLKRFRRDDSQCDLTLRVQGTDFRAHKCVIMANSDYFNSMFTHPLKESAETVVELQGLNSDTFETLFDFMYTSNITLTEETLQSILSASTYLQIPKALEKCSGYLEETMDALSCAETLVTAGNHGLTSLELIAMEFLAKNFVIATESLSFLYLSPKQVLTLLGSDYTFVCAELDIFDAIVRWFRHDFEQRAKYVGKIMKKIRFGLISVVDIEEEIVPLSKEFENREFSKLVTDARAWHSRKYEQSVSDKVNSTARVSPYMTLVSGMIDSNQDSSLAIRMCRTPWKRRHRWEPVGTTPRNFGKAAVACAVVGDFLYVVGFPKRFLASQSEIHDDVNWFMRYDPRQEEWLKLRKLNHKHSGMKLTSVGDKLYASGSSDVTIVECYLIRTNRWVDAFELPHKQFLHSAESHGGKLYIAGGIFVEEAGSTACDDLIRFDPATKEVATLKPMGTPRFGHSIVCHGNKLYSFGGTTYHPEVAWGFAESSECYDIADNTWTTLPSMPTPRGFSGVTVLEDQIYVVGGTCDGFGKTSVEVYDVNEKKWEKRAMIQRRLYYLGLVMLRHPFKKFKNP